MNEWDKEVKRVKNILLHLEEYGDFDHRARVLLANHMIVDFDPDSARLYKKMMKSLRKWFGSPRVENGDVVSRCSKKKCRECDAIEAFQAFVEYTDKK